MNARAPMHLLAAGLAAGLLGCGPAESPATAAIEIDTVGDTVIVRNHAAAQWQEPVTLVEELSIGELDGPDEYTFGRIDGIWVADDGSAYVVDGQARTVRVYAPDGTHLRSIGRQGRGPGELERPSGIVFLPDGRIAVRDFGNARINLYSPDGEPLATWPIPSGFGTSDPLRVDTAGNVYTQLITERHDDGTFETGLLRLRDDGATADTLRVPDLGFEPPRLVARFEQGSNRSVSWASVPFAPDAIWAFSPFGYFVTAVTDRYALEHRRPGDRILRVERAWQPVRVQPEEKKAHRDFTTARMRGTGPGWSWSGPDIPSTKAALRRIHVGQDGRVWAQVPQPGERFEPDRPEPRPGEPERPVLDWREPLAFDVFEVDGRYLGQLRLPERATPVFMRGDLVWAVVRDELDVQRLVRYRIRQG